MNIETTYRDDNTCIIYTIPIALFEDECHPWNVADNAAITLDRGDWSKQLVCGADKEVDGLSKLKGLAKHPICGPPTDVTVKQNGKRDGDATIDLQGMKILDTLSRTLNLYSNVSMSAEQKYKWTNLDSKSTNCSNNIQ